MKQNDFQKVANQVSFVTIVVNILLAFMKLLAGVFAHSNAMISDSIHSASDVFSTMIVVIGIKLSSKQPDKEHPYGHERMECVAAIVLSMVLFMTGLGIGVEALTDVLKGEYSHLQVPGMLALAAAVISIVSKEAMYWYTRYYAKKIDSSALMADAWHHRSDAFSSIVFIVKAAYEIFKDAMDKMVDHSCDEKTEEQLRACVLQNPDVARIDLLQTRIFGNKIYADIEIEVDGSMPLREAHKIAELVHNSIEKTFPKVKHIMVHVNPEIDRK